MPKPSTSSDVPPANRLTPNKNKVDNLKVITPEQVKPFPKAGPRKNRNKFGKKPGKTRVLTDTPEKCEIEREQQKRQQKLADKEGRAIKRKLKLSNKCKSKKIKKIEIEEDTSGDESEISSGESVLHLSDDEDVLDVVDYQTKDLKQGIFVLVEFKGGSRQSIKYRYACIVQRPPDTEESVINPEISVMSLKSIDATKKIFIPKEEDVSFVQIKDVLGILPQPDLLQHGDRMRYAFPKRVNVYEQ